MAPLLEVKNLKKHFKTPNGLLHAVDGVSFTVDEGKTIGVVGESGCGKSTLGKVIIRLLEPTSGQVLFEGKDVQTMKELELRRKMQIIFQDPFSSLNPRMTVSELITEPMIIHHLAKNDDELMQRLTNLMDTVGLARRFANAYPHELDGGRRQRIGIARALALEPKFIVCDEPVSALDVSIQAQIINLMQDLQDEKGLTYMFVTHDLSVVRHISTEIMVMYLGMVVEKAPVEELFTQTLHPYTKALLAAIPEPVVHRTRERKIIRGEITSPINPKPGCRFAPRCEFAKDICFKDNAPLEEISPEHFVACHYVKQINGL